MANKPIGILHVTRSLAGNGGIEEYIRILASRLDRKKFRLGICSIQDSPCKLLPCFKELNIPVYCGNRKGSLLNPFATIWVQNVIQNFGADIVHTHTDKGNFHGRLAAKRAKVPVITTHHDMGDVAFSRSPEIKQQVRLLEKRAKMKVKPGLIDSILYPFFNVGFNEINGRVICVSNTVKSIYTVTPTDKRFVAIPSPYDESAFTENYRGLQEKSVTLGVVGRLTQQKGQHTLLKAVKELKEEGVAVKIRIIGDGTLRKSLKEAAQSLGIVDETIFCGDMPHGANLYEGIDIYLQPSLMEGCSITLLEAMATGLPVIASDIGGPAELVLNEETGLLVPAGDSNAFAGAIKRFIANREEARKMGHAAAKRVRTEFSSKKFIERMSTVYCGLLRELS